MRIWYEYTNYDFNRPLSDPLRVEEYNNLKKIGLDVFIDERISELNAAFNQKHFNERRFNKISLILGIIGIIFLILHYLFELYLLGLLSLPCVFAFAYFMFDFSYRNTRASFSAYKKAVSQYYVFHNKFVTKSNNYISYTAFTKKDEYLNWVDKAHNTLKKANRV